MNSLIQFAKSQPKIAAILGVSLLVVIFAAASELATISHALRGFSSGKDSSSAAGPSFSTVPADPQAKMMAAKYRISPNAAPYISGAKLKIISESNTSVHYELTFPDGVVSDETVSMSPGKPYSPSIAELTHPSKNGKHVFNPTLTVKKVGPKEAEFTLRYSMPETELPPEIQQRLHQSTQSALNRFFTLVPAANAQENGGGGDNGAGFVTWNMVEMVKSMNVKQFEAMEWEKSAKVMDNILTARDIVNGYNDISKWLGEIEELKDCAEHPTNPLAQAASYGKDYQKVIDSLNDAENEIQMTAFPKVANIAAGAVTQKLPFGTGVLISPITAANDEAIEQFADETINEAKKNIVPCDQPMMPGDLRPMTGTIEYKYIFKGDNSKEEREAEGKFELNPINGGLEATGEAKAKFEVIGQSINPICTGMALHQTQKGDLHITGGGGGTPFGGVLELHVDGDLPLENTQLVSEGTKCLYQTRTWTKNFNFNCRFDRLDMVHGGEYSTFTKGDGGFGTCKIELARK